MKYGHRNNTIIKAMHGGTRLLDFVLCALQALGLRDTRRNTVRSFGEIQFTIFEKYSKRRSVFTF